MGYSEIQTYTLYIPGRSRMMIFAVMAQHYPALRRLAVMRTPGLAHVESPELFLGGWDPAQAARSTMIVADVSRGRVTQCISVLQ